ncbi:MAG TPA: hypothetical protein VHZ55_23845 [Bryobacteraceae bacterium]|jgi:uncharacterized protein YbjT (DUF2867 family)|nr:hypothetical protein [Bryobacteraceae bacterium]
MPLAHGGFIGAAQDGNIAAATREDYAEAAVAVLTNGGHEGKTYELAGDHSFTMKDLAEAVSGWAGRPLLYSDLPPSEYRKTSGSTGLPEAIVDLLVATDVAIARGDVDSNSHELPQLDRAEHAGGPRGADERAEADRAYKKDCDKNSNHYVSIFVFASAIPMPDKH